MAPSVAGEFGSYKLTDTLFSLVLVRVQVLRGLKCFRDTLRVAPLETTVYTPVSSPGKVGRKGRNRENIILLNEIY